MRNKNSRNEFQPMGEAIRELLNTYRISSRFDEAQVVNAWERLAGKPIARRTRKIFMRDRVLFVELESPSMKHDFSLHKKQVLELFQKEFGAGVVGGIVVM